MTDEAPHLLDTHPDYPDGFPPRENDDLIGLWQTTGGDVVAVMDHPHGYEIHFSPCHGCAACGSGNYRDCADHGIIVTVAADAPEAVLEYLANAGSAPHVIEHSARLAAAADDEAALREQEAAAAEAELAERIAREPSHEERLAAVRAELEALTADKQ